MLDSSTAWSSSEAEMLPENNDPGHVKKPCKKKTQTHVESRYAKTILVY